MKYKVFHTKSWALNANLHFSTDDYVPNKDDYDLVAVVESEQIGDVFRLTNHIDYAWWENEGVELVKESRSTSVGDLAEDKNGKLYLCASVGWEEKEWSHV